MYTMSQVLNQFGDAYTATHTWTPEHSKVATCIRACRTERLGGYRLHCESCGLESSRYCSCRNRHCPQCQKRATDVWREQQQSRLLPVSYFHLVFTLPHDLNAWIRLHPSLFYGLLFKATWQVLKRFGEDPKRLDGQLGMTAVLHTWGQQLDQHVHLHCLIPAGAWSKAKEVWNPSKSNYLFPSKALSRCFRGTMVSLIRTAWMRGELTRVTHSGEVDRTLKDVMSKDWVVYTKACHGKPERVVDYLSKYTYRIAISESRIVSIEGDQVRFRWKDYRRGGNKTMSLKGVEFMRRFLQHVLPKGFMRIRHYGFMSNRWRAQRQGEIKASLGEMKPTEAANQEASTEADPVSYFCCHCQSRDVHIVKWITPVKLRR